MLLTEVCAPGAEGYSLVPAPFFKGLGAAIDLLCAVSRDGALYAAGTCINLAGAAKVLSVKCFCSKKEKEKYK